LIALSTARSRVEVFAPSQHGDDDEGGSQMGPSLAGVTGGAVVSPRPSAIDDPIRLDSLERTGLLDSPPEEIFDRFTRLAAQVLGVRVALLSLVGEDRQFFKSAFGLSGRVAAERGTPLSHSYCKHVVTSGSPLVVPDAREHPLLKDNPAIVDLNAISYCGVPISDPEGRVLGTVCVVDEDARQWRPDEVQALADIAQAVTSEVHLRLLAGELQDKNAALYDFVAVASHDIRSPLAIILNYTHMLVDAEEFGLSEEEKTDFLGTVREEAQRASRLVADLLDVTKLEAGVEHPRTEEVELHAIAATEVSRNSHVGVTLNLHGELKVLADPDDVRRILSCLLDNAFNHGAAPVEVGSALTRTTVSICVSDRGDGVPTEFVPRLFEKFERARKKSGVRGSGLGLAIAAGLARRNGGSLRYEPNEPQGSRFIVELPRATGGAG